eukprot:5811326-Pleurochrysis_carterae.AAC.2
MNQAWRHLPPAAVNACACVQDARVPEASEGGVGEASRRLAAGHRDHAGRARGGQGVAESHAEALLRRGGHRRAAGDRGDARPA